MIKLIVVAAVALLVACSWQDNSQELQVLCQGSWSGYIVSDGRTIAVSGKGYETIGVAPDATILAAIVTHDTLRTDTLMLDTLQLRIMEFVATGGVKRIAVTTKYLPEDTATIKNF